MPDNEEIIRNLTNHYHIKVIKAFGNVDSASKSIEIIAKSLKEIYRYFEPDFFSGDFFVCKNFDDKPCFDDSRGTYIYDKNILLNRTSGLMIIQVFDDNSKMILWENENFAELFDQKTTLTYLFKSNKEYFYADKNEIDITICSKGSRFATQFNDLVSQLQEYSITKISKSSCNHFSDSWADEKRLFFRGGGRGNNIPEKFMQLSLYEYLSSTIGRGISMESSREYNISGETGKPKPVDIKIHWREANRTAIIELKFLGTVLPDSGGAPYTHSDSRANEGIEQLKGYHDNVLSDTPSTIIKSHLVVIDGRRNNLVAGKTTITAIDGMHYKDLDIVIDADKKFHETIQGFEKPIKMFAEPICL